MTTIFTTAGFALVSMAAAFYSFGRNERALGCLLLAGVLGISWFKLESPTAHQNLAPPLQEVVKTEASQGDPIRWLSMSVLVAQTDHKGHASAWSMIGSGSSHSIWGSQGPARYSVAYSIHPAHIAIRSEEVAGTWQAIKARSQLAVSAMASSPTRQVPDSDWYYCSMKGVCRTVVTTGLTFLVPVQEGDKVKDCSTARFSNLYRDKINACLLADPDYVAQDPTNRAEPYLMPLWSMLLYLAGLTFLVGHRHRALAFTALMVVVPLGVLSLGRVAFEASRTRLEGGIATSKDYRDLIGTRYFAEEAMTALFDRAASRSNPSHIGPALLALGCKADQCGPRQLVADRRYYQSNRLRRSRDFEDLAASIPSVWQPMLEQISQR